MYDLDAGEVRVGKDGSAVVVVVVVAPLRADFRSCSPWLLVLPPKELTVSWSIWARLGRGSVDDEEGGGGASLSSGSRRDELATGCGSLVSECPSLDASICYRQGALSR